MIYKGKQPLYINQSSNIRRVLILIQQGYTNRAEMAEILNLTNLQVRNAIWNLQRYGLVEAKSRLVKNGRGSSEAVYQVREVKENKSPLAGISFIFNFCGNSSGSGD